MGKKSKRIRANAPAKNDSSNSKVKNNVELLKTPVAKYVENKNMNALPTCMGIENAPLSNAADPASTSRTLNTAEKSFQVICPAKVAAGKTNEPTKASNCGQGMVFEGHRSRSCSLGLTDNESASSDNNDKLIEMLDSSGLMKSVRKDEDWFVEEDFVDEDGWLVVDG